jgi:hypothetical protein
MARGRCVARPPLLGYHGTLARRQGARKEQETDVIPDPTLRRFAASLGAVLALAAVAGCGPPKTAERPRLQIVDLKTVTGDEAGTHLAIGTVRNNSSRTYASVFVKFACFDAEDNSLGTVVETTENLAPKSSWKFRALISDPAAKRIKLLDVGGTPAPAE